MATGTQIPVEQYLSTDYKREPEYIHGEIVERPTPNLIDSIIQQSLGSAGLGWAAVLS